MFCLHNYGNDVNIEFQSDVRHTTEWCDSRSSVIDSYPLFND